MNDTDAMIRRLASEAGTARGTSRIRFPMRILLSSVAALIVSLALILAWFADGTDIAAPLRSQAFWFKVSCMFVLAVGAGRLLYRAGSPGSGRHSGLALLPGIGLLLIGMALDRTAYPLLGRHVTSVPICVLAIVIAALPALVVLLRTLRHGVVTMPAAAGATAGLLAGALGGMAYAIACRNDGAAFVGLWYPTAIAVVCAIGALVGQRFLRW